MRKFMGIFALFPGSEICVYADTKEEARKEVVSHFASGVERELEMVEVKARTERCDICQYTFIPPDIIERDGKRLCVYCYDDKYGYEELMPEDIPF